MARSSAAIKFWNEWNAQTREHAIGRTEADQRAHVRALLQTITAGRQERPSIIDVGCGAGWLTPDLLEFGAVTATDLSDEVLARAQAQWPAVRFVAGDFFELDFAASAYDIAVSLEVIAHVPNQPAFAARLADVLKPGGDLILATQNKRVLGLNRLAKAAPGQIRQHLHARDLIALLEPDFEIQSVRFLTPVFGRRLLPNVIRHAIADVSRAAFNGAFVRWLEKQGLGWTIMVHARKRP